MGWSATARACEIEREWSKTCESLTGMSNRYRGKDGRLYFYEIGREREDGAIVGVSYLMDEEMKRCWKKGGWRIEPDGKITRRPTAFPA